MTTYWLWSSINKKHLDELVVGVLFSFFITLPVDIVALPLEIIGWIIYLVGKEVDNMATTDNRTVEEIKAEIEKCKPIESEEIKDEKRTESK